MAAAEEVMMLSLVGLGLWDEQDITLRGLQEARGADLVFLESYTSRLMGLNKKRLEELIEKEVKEADREFIESGRVLEHAGEKRVCVLVGGDPMVATTHADLVLRAKERGIPVRIVHNASIYSAVCETGLQAYKFGRSATIVFWEDNYKPTSFYDVMVKNKELGLHTLFFLDLRAHENRFMTVREALQELLEISAERKDGLFTPRTRVVAVSRLGSPEQRIAYGVVEKIMTDDLPPLSVIIVPGKLHPVEKEFLESLL